MERNDIYAALLKAASLKNQFYAAMFEAAEKIGVPESDAVVKAAWRTLETQDGGPEDNVLDQDSVERFFRAAHCKPSFLQTPNDWTAEDQSFLRALGVSA